MVEQTAWHERSRDENGAYINDRDKEIERYVANRLNERFGWDMKPYPQYANIDFYCVNRSNRIAAFVEVKGRGHNFGLFPTVFVSQNKYLNLMFATLTSAAQGLYVCHFTDGQVAYINTKRLLPGVLVETRSSRPREGRIVAEPMYEVPIGEWELL